MFSFTIIASIGVGTCTQSLRFRSWVSRHNHIPTEFTLPDITDLLRVFLPIRYSPCFAHSYKIRPDLMLSQHIPFALVTWWSLYQCICLFDIHPAWLERAFINSIGHLRLSLGSSSKTSPRAAGLRHHIGRSYWAACMFLGRISWLNM